jgi:hypothetical protein
MIWSDRYKKNMSKLRVLKKKYQRTKTKSTRSFVIRMLLNGKNLHMWLVLRKLFLGIPNDAHEGAKWGWGWGWKGSFCFQILIRTLVRIVHRSLFLVCKQCVLIFRFLLRCKSRVDIYHSFFFVYRSKKNCFGLIVFCIVYF